MKLSTITVTSTHYKIRVKSLPKMKDVPNDIDNPCSQDMYTLKDPTSMIRMEWSQTRSLY